MKMLLTACLLCICRAMNAQNDNLASLRARCLPDATPSTLRAIVQVESGGNLYAMQIDFPHAIVKHWSLPPGTLRLERQPRDRAEAIQWLDYFERSHVFVDLGLMQVSTAEARRRGIPAKSLLDPCTNLRVGWQILEEDYTSEVKIYGPGQLALRHAISRYNTGNSQKGIENGYLSRVLAAAQTFNDHRLFPR
jgi:type IV secretion system protein VirB1